LQINGGHKDYLYFTEPEQFPKCGEVPSDTFEDIVPTGKMNSAGLAHKKMKIEFEF
jgi:hypothetical protein|tara:strand:+ start:13382 stop:13549 length:168 start_codon:yes stop_codon:yes gene_type:complete